MADGRRAGLHLFLEPQRWSRTLGSGVLALALALASPTSALADRAERDRTGELVQTVTSSRDEKARLAAVLALGKLKDPRAVPALIRALDDKSNVVRAVAATALGFAGDSRAEGPLTRKLNDADPTVRARAREALERLSPPVVEAPPARQVAPKERPRLVAQKPAARVLVVVKSAANRTPQGGALMGDRLRDYLTEAIDDSPELTTDEALLGKRSSAFQVDGSIVRMKRRTSGRYVELTCEVTLSISTPTGKIVSIVRGSATVQVPRADFRRGSETALWLQALENAVRGAHQNLRAYVVQQS